MMYSYAWRVRRPADLAAGCYECARCCVPDRPMGLYSNLERAHLSDDDDDIVLLCRVCHRRLDMQLWLKGYRAWLEMKRAQRVAEMDLARPILKYLMEAS